MKTLEREPPVKGKFTATIRNKTCGAKTRFVVVKGRINSTLFGFPPIVFYVSVSKDLVLMSRDLTCTCDA